MLRLLLRLWWLQQRRNFHKRDAFVACYIIFLYVVMGVSFFLSFTENGGELGGEDMPGRPRRGPRPLPRLLPGISQ